MKLKVLAVFTFCLITIVVTGQGDLRAEKNGPTTSSTVAPTIPDSPRDFPCGKSRLGKQILANDGWNYRCQQVGKKHIWVHVDCVFSGITCITLPPNPIAPSVGESFVYPNLGGVIIEFQTSTGDYTDKRLEIATDERFVNVVFVGEHRTLYDPSWRCDVRMCGEIFETDGSSSNSGDRLVGVSEITGTVWARVTISNSHGKSTKLMGLTFPGPQMVSPQTTSTTTTLVAADIAQSGNQKKVVTIKCKKGKLIKNVTGAKPKCPKRWKRSR